MNIGLLTQALPYLPSRGGFRLYGANLMRCFKKLGHNVDLVSLLENGDEDHLEWPKEYCASVCTIPKSSSSWMTPLNVSSGYLAGKPLRYRQAVRKILDANVSRWDVLHVEGGYMGALIPEGLPIPKVLSLHDSWTLRCEEMVRCGRNLGERTYYRLLGLYEPRFERLVTSRFDRSTVVADRDLEALRAVAPTSRLKMINYGTDTEYFHPMAIEKNPNVVVFHSHLGYAPNIEAATEFANAILPLIRAKHENIQFRLVGAAPAPEIQDIARRPGIELLANLPDLRSAVCSAAIYVCAISHGTGLKSKVLEAMAMGMPIVCYPGSTVGLNVVSGTHLLVAQTPQEFADHVLDLLASPSRAEQLARAGRDLVEREYSWIARAHAYEDLYRTVIEEARTRTSR